MNRGARFASVINSSVLFVILWAALTEGDLYQVWVGLGFVVLAALSTTWISSPVQAPRKRLRIRPVAAYLAYFIYHSLKGGIDVARRAFRIGRNVHPIYLNYRLRIPASSENARIIFAISICLFPGSLSCLFHEDTLIIQVLDEELADMTSIQKLEELVAGLFAVPLQSIEESTS